MGGGGASICNLFKDVKKSFEAVIDTSYYTYIFVFRILHHLFTFRMTRPKKTKLLWDGLLFSMTEWFLIFRSFKRYAMLSKMVQKMGTNFKLI